MTCHGDDFFGTVSEWQFRTITIRKSRDKSGRRITLVITYKAGKNDRVSVSPDRP
jgi:hypothetical protein